jgi:hypothetical protein
MIFRFGKVLQRARAMAEDSDVKLDTHVIARHPVRGFVELAKVELLVSKQPAIQRSTTD